MRLLSKEEETDDAAEVTWEDQQRINRFSSLNSRTRDDQDALTQLKDAKEALDDLASELELADDDSKVMYKIGETFVHLPLARAQKRIAKDQEDLDRRIEALNERTATHEGEMKELKVQLYAKFGRQINLD